MSSTRRAWGRGGGRGQPSGSRSNNPPARSFQEASAQIQASLQRHLSKQSNDPELSESESDSSDGDDKDELVGRVLSAYGDSDADILQVAKDALNNSLHSAACLICISNIKRTEPIWSCVTCFVSFHITCVQRWAKDTIFQKKQLLEEDPDLSPEQIQTRAPTSYKWSCPKCRGQYDQGQIPYRYTCYCGKEIDPVFDPWVAPHSCGEKCGRSLESGCDHKCIVLCHPGPCPPCPQTVKNRCYCGNSQPTVRRCSNKAWACGKKCNKTLYCNQHQCKENCHSGDCPPCSRTSIQSCDCGKAKEHRACANPLWNCNTVCGKKLSCEFHNCDLICHKGNCPSCPLSETRYCPCGKSSYDLPCTKATPTCGDTCGKTLACGSHTCPERCHRGACPQCHQMMDKSCRCGAKSKEVQCSKVYTCDVKCKKLRDCRRHPCNKKCCDGQCPPCDHTCNKTLQCKNHKCESRCHQGPCYPCIQTVAVTCNCGKTKIVAPCGRERNSRPPRCRQPCLAHSDCHHPTRTPHKCHPPPCPSCKQPCNQPLACSHICPIPCHDNVKIKVEDPVKPAGPWEKRGPIIKIEKLPCPPCEAPVSVTCLGAHETAPFPCHAAKSGSCGRQCGRQLSCGNHTCSRDCHKVKNATDELNAGSNCKKCEKECVAPREDGCSHPCNRPCHPAPCDRCSANIKLKCHCGMSTQYRRCGEYSKANEALKVEMGSCTDQCPKLLECGHRCCKTCHVGQCSAIADCKKKVKSYCPCKRRKVEFRCNDPPSNSVVCDSACKEAETIAKAEREKEEKEKREKEIARNQKEIEIFERKGEGKRKRRNRSRQFEEDDPTMWEKYKFYIVIVLGFFSAATMAYVLQY